MAEGLGLAEVRLDGPSGARLRGLAQQEPWRRLTKQGGDMSTELCFVLFAAGKEWNVVG